jgi:hypothetical protein
MSTQKFFKVAFAASGDISPIPDAAQIDGSISYTEGYGLDYELDPTSDPDAKRIERTKFNDLLRDVTLNIQQYQYYGNPEFITTAQNGGTPVSYAKGAMVNYDTGGGVFQLYTSLVANNTVLPGSDPTKWRATDPWSDSLIATAADYVTPSSNALVTSPGRLATATREGRLTYAAATRSSAAYSLTLPGAAFTLVAGAQVDFTVPDASPAGPLTLKVGALATVALQTNAQTDPAAGDLQANRVYTARYNGTAWLITQALPSQLTPPLALPDRLAATTASVAASTDLNTALSNGWYRAAAGVTNGPSALSAVALQIEVSATDSNNVSQIARAQTGVSETTTSTYQRFRIAGTWGPWFRVYSTATEIQRIAIEPGFYGFTAGPSAPNGWLVANGQAVSRTTYAALFAVIGTLYGAGNGTTTFNVPDLVTRFLRGGTPDGTQYADTVGPHLHQVNPPPRNSEGGSGYTVTGGTGTGESLFAYNTELGFTGSETAPKHMLGLPLIKY